MRGRRPPIAAVVTAESPVQNPAQQVSTGGRTETSDRHSEAENAVGAGVCVSMQGGEVGATGLEHGVETPRKATGSNQGGAECGAVGRGPTATEPPIDLSDIRGLARLIATWPALCSLQKAATLSAAGIGP